MGALDVPFRTLPFSGGDTPRPVLDVEFVELPRTPIACLLDTGSLHNRFGIWVAHLAGVDLSRCEPEAIGVGGHSVLARSSVMRLSVGGTSWEAPVSFCDPWPFDFGLLGQEGFLRWFTVTIKAADRVLTVSPA